MRQDDTLERRLENASREKILLEKVLVVLKRPYSLPDFVRKLHRLEAAFTLLYQEKEEAGDADVQVGLERAVVKLDLERRFALKLGGYLRSLHPLVAEAVRGVIAEAYPVLPLEVHRMYATSYANRIPKWDPYYQGLNTAFSLAHRPDLLHGSQQDGALFWLNRIGDVMNALSGQGVPISLGRDENSASQALAEHISAIEPANVLMSLALPKGFFPSLFDAWYQLAAERDYSLVVRAYASRRKALAEGLIEPCC